MSGLSPFFGTLAGRAHEKAEKDRAEFEKERDAERQVWMDVLKNPDSTPEQRKKAADSLNKIYGTKGEKSPFSKIVGVFDHVTGKGKDSLPPQLQSLIGAPENKNPEQAAPQGQAPTEPPKPEAPKPQLQTLDGKQEPSDKPVAKPPNPAQHGVATKILSKVGQGLTSGPKAIGDLMSYHPPSLPPLSGDMFPTADTLRESRKKDLKSDLETREPFIEKQIKLRGEESQKTAAARARNAMSSKTKYPGEAIINTIPENLRDKLVDSNGVPVDPNGLYGPIAGDKMGVEYDDEGNPTLTAIRVGSGAARVRTSEQLVIDPKTNELKAITMEGSTNTPEPPKGQEAKTGAGQPPALKTRPNTLQPLGGGTAPKSEAAPKKTKGVRTIGKYIRPQQFNALQKSATAIDEARNSLIGDDPKQPAGLQADLGIFDNPQSVEKIRNYLGFIEKNLAGESARVTGLGPAAALEWMSGLPTMVSNLQQQAQQELATTLSPEEQQFVSDYFRSMGTIGGLRASTGMPASRWSFATLYNEMPTPGKVTSKADAQRRIDNFIQETNVVAKRNPLLSKVDTKSSDPMEGKQIVSPDGKSTATRHNGKWIDDKTGKEVK